MSFRNGLNSFGNLSCDFVPFVANERVAKSSAIIRGLLEPPNARRERQREADRRADAV